MEFRDYAASETAALVDRLTKAAATSAQASAQAAAQRVSEEAKARLDSTKAELKARTHEAEELAAALKTARSQADGLRTELKAQKERTETTIAELTRAHDATKKADAARSKAEAALAQEARAHAAIENELKEVRGAMDATLVEAERVGKRLETESAEKASLAEKLSAAKSQVQAAEAKSQTINTIYKASIARVETLEREQADADRARQELQARLDAAVAAEAKLQQRLEDAERDLEGARLEIESSQQETVSPDALLDGLLEAFEELSSASTITEVLIALTESLAAEFRRVALFRVSGNKLEGQHQIGFDFKTDIAKVVVPLGMDSLLARAVASGCIESLGADEAPDNRAPFGGAPSCGLALPILVQGETLAIAYADDGAEGDQREGPQAHALRGRFAELLLRHAVAVLMRLTTELKTLAELREHAARLLNHTEEMYASDVEDGVQGTDLRSRLAENLDCARRLYAQRIAIEGPAAAGLLEERLVTLLEKRGATPFGRDLAQVAGRSTASGSAAEAS